MANANGVLVRSVGKLLFELNKCYSGHIEESFRRGGLLVDEAVKVRAVLTIRCEENFVMEWREWLSNLHK